MNRIIKVIFSALFGVGILLANYKISLAVNVNINSFPSVIDSLNSYEVNASVSGATNATNYLRVDLYKEGTTNYFGETFNGNDWYGGSDGKSYYPLQIQNSSASATFYFQIGNPSLTQYPGPGTYKLKIRRYTSSGSASSNDIQTPVDVQINYTFITPSPNPTSTPTISPTPIPTDFVATPPPKTATPRPTTTPTPYKTPSPKPTKSPEPSASSSSNPQILGESTQNSPPSKPQTASLIEEPKSNQKILPITLISVGVLFMGFAVYNIIHGQKVVKTS